MHSDKNVDNIDKVKGVVDDVPTNREVFSHFPEDGTTHHKNDIIKDGTEYDKQPIVMWILTCVDGQVAFIKATKVHWSIGIILGMGKR